MNDNSESIKEIPYGIADYEIIRTGNYYYVDKTPYLKTIEKAEGRFHRRVTSQVRFFAVKKNEAVNQFQVFLRPAPS